MPEIANTIDIPILVQQKIIKHIAFFIDSVLPSLGPYDEETKRACIEAAVTSLSMSLMATISQQSEKEDTIILTKSFLYSIISNMECSVFSLTEM
ncbi:MAG TPA: hypothetical protein VMW10_13020 [Alphaproteobacteria bacterium]|nr:hypothetical protein [Alphaproteobacteria bacterium]